MIAQMPISSRPILVFLPAVAAKTIASTVEQAGFPAVTVSTVADLFDALRSGAFSVAVTVRPDIDTIRNIEAISVVNLEVFFHAPIGTEP